ncbi:hypothetical protein [Jeotgalibacillus malaysiensis]|uniref:hypothetical protein n=1 Tax=Jeotgalibacillus malaysiensis TaxID=1508404 RepID=UPI00384B82F8
MIRKMAFFICLSLVLVACSESDATNDETTPAETPASAEAAEEKQPNEDTNDYRVEENDQFKMTFLYEKNPTGIEGTAGPIDYIIPGVALAEIEIKDEYVASTVNKEVGDVLQAVFIGGYFENTSDEEVTLFFPTAKLVTDTKEQLDPNMMISETFDPKFLGNVVQEGTNAYILNNSKVEDLKSLQLNILAPRIGFSEIIGDDLSIEIPVNKE